MKQTLTTMLAPCADICGNCFHRVPLARAELPGFVPFSEKCGNPESAYKDAPVRQWHTCSKFERHP
jgi:hypothetical protein